MRDLIFLLPITILGVVGAIFGLWLKWSADRDERRQRAVHQPPTTNP